MSEHIGTKVTIPGTRGFGILRYYGGIKGKMGQFGGIELQGPIAATRGKNSGDVDGIQYFPVQIPMTGLFLPWDRLKQANPQLESKIAVKLKSPDVNTTRSARSTSLKESSPSSVSSLTASSSSLRTSTSSPLYGNQQIQIPKRNGLFENTSRPSSDEDNFKTKYMSTQAEMKEKIAILNELQATVNEIQPLLEEYEFSLVEKDKKLLKQKQDFENSREEWRQSLDLMTASQQENEEYYIKQIENLQQKLAQVDKNVDSQLLKDKEVELANREKEILQRDEEIKRLTSLNKTLTDSNAQLKSSDTNEQDATSAAALAQLQSEMELLKESKQKLQNETEILTKELSDSRSQMQKITSEHKAKVMQLQDELEIAKAQPKDDFLVAELKQEIALLKEKNNKLGDQGSNNVPDANKLEQQIEELITENRFLKADNALLQQLQKQVESLTSENKQLHASNDATKVLALEEQIKQLTLNTTGTEEPTQSSKEIEQFRSEIEELQHELAMRPTFEELVDLQKSLDELDSLHKSEVQNKHQEITKLHKEIEKLKLELQDATDTIENKENKIVEAAAVAQECKNTPNDSSLLIYSPPTKVDPSEGKQDWCGLCERSGHSSLHCPYENDIF